MKKSHIIIALVTLVLIMDQALKIWIKTTFCYGEEVAILGASWAKLHFVENPGMAFGWALGGYYGKLILSLFRLGAIAFLVYYIASLLRANTALGLVSSFALILAGAIGNMIDSAFYGLVFSESTYHCAHGPATFMPEAGGYAGFLQGKVVDMFFFPLVQGNDGSVLFFQPVFNIADAAITIGVLCILLFHRQYFREKTPEAQPEAQPETPSDGADAVAPMPNE